MKVLYDKSMVGKDELAKFLDADIKAAVGVDTGNQGDIRKSIALMQSHVPPDLITAAREVREDVREIIGFSRNQAGAFEAPSGRRTAYEAQVVQAASMIRIDERRDAMADLLSEVIRWYNQQVFDNWTTDRVVDVVGPDGARYWIRFNGRELKGEFAYKINPEEGIPQDKRTQKEEILRFIELATKVPGLDVQYLLTQYAEQFDWIDPKLLFPREGMGGSPEKAMPFYEFVRRGAGNAPSTFPGLQQQGAGLG